MKFIYIILFLISGFVLNCFAGEELNYTGKEFIVCFPQNSAKAAKYLDDDLNLNILATGENNTKVYVNSGDGQKIAEYFLLAGKLIDIKIDNKFELNREDSVTSKTIIIKSDEPVTLTAYSKRSNSGESYRVLPVSSLGKEYKLITTCNSKYFRSFFAVAAIDDSVKFKIDSWFKPIAGQYFVNGYYLLNKGQVFYFVMPQFTNLPEDLMIKELDLSSLKISANKNVAVFSGHECGEIPYKTGFCDQLLEQLLPAKYFGQKYLITPFEGRSKYTFKIVPVEKNTEVTINGKWADLLPEEEVYLNNKATGSFLVETSKPVVVAEFSQGNKNGDSKGDPSMIMLPPAEHYKNEYMITVPNDKNWDQYINVIIRDDASNSFQIDGENKTSELSGIGKSGYSYFTLKLTPGAHNLTADKPFGIIQYARSTEKDKFISTGNF